MSRFYASIKGSRGEATRQGSPASGIAGHIRGWDIGIRVIGSVYKDEDTFSVYLTGGSNGHSEDVFLGRLSKTEMKFGGKER